MNTTQKGNEFENLVLSIIEKTYPIKAELYRGGSDRGRDIIAIYEYNGLSRTVIIECKKYNTSLTQKDICNSLNWAVSRKPDLYYIWTTSYITPSTKDYILSIARQYKLTVAWEESDSVKKYVNAYRSNNNEIFSELRKYILKLLKINMISSQLEYTSFILPSNHKLVNRKDEKDLLLDNNKHCFYLVGPSCVGKTQLAKNIAKHYYNKGYFIFWHRVLTQDNENQIKNLLESLDTFFSCVLKNNELNDYFTGHGFFLTTSLLNIVKMILSKHKCVLFIDDVHKCNSNNSQYIEFLVQIFEIKQCRYYLLGWFNIFDIYDFRLNRLIEFLDIEPLSAQHIRQIALESNESLSEEELNIIVAKSDGLPGIAEIIPINKGCNDFEGLTSYFRSIISIMETKEKTLLFALSVTRASLPINILEGLDFRIACDKLTQKRLTKFEGNFIVLHDKYKEHISKLLYIMPKDTYYVLKICAKDIPLIYIDLLSIFLDSHQVSEFDTLLKDQFSFLLSMGYEIMLFDLIQKREKLNNRNIINILVKKMILLDRNAEYDILENYINITKDIINESNEDYYMWNYIFMRFMYFRCDFTNLLKNFFDNFSNFIKYPIDLYLQILFIVGRTYYIMGEIKIAAEIYYYVFNLSMRNNLSNLATKAIHRICIIEEKIGLYGNAKQTLEVLIEERYFISSKRLSFAFYRLSKCALGNQDYEAALKYNSKSIEIKESLNAQRGLIFSMKLYSQIYYEMSDYPMALYWAEESLKQAQKINISKEIVATGLVYAKALLATNQNESALKILKDIIERAGKLCLSHRLKSLISICQKHNFIELYNTAIKALTYSENIILETKKVYEYYLKDIVQNSINTIKINDLIDNKKALSPFLLLL